MFTLTLKLLQTYNTIILKGHSHKSLKEPILDLRTHSRIPNPQISHFSPSTMPTSLNADNTSHNAYNAADQGYNDEDDGPDNDHQQESVFVHVVQGRGLTCWGLGIRLGLL